MHEPRSLSRRNCLRLIGQATATAATAALAPRWLKAEERPMNDKRDGKPNIVLIMVDDMGWSDLGCYGSEIRTPNLDSLAAQGTRFTQFYNTARCCPSRAALLTGLYPHQAGVGHMIKDLGHPAYQGFLNDRCVTIAEALRQGGYVTCMSGKWHVGEAAAHWPVRRGFDRYFGLISGACNYWRLDGGRQMAIDEKPWTPPDDGSFYMTDAIGDRAVGFIDDHRRSARRDDPMFLYVAYTAPHWPLHARPRDIERYRDVYGIGWDALRERRHKRQLETGLVDPGWKLSPRHPRAPAWDGLSPKRKEAEAMKMAVYAAQVDAMDQSVGRVLDALRRTGMEDNTLVLFLSDNGGCAEEVDRGKPGVPPGPADSFMSYGLPWANASNTPLRLFKQYVHEGGISTPLIARGPGIAAGRLSAKVGHVIDLMPTCLDAAGVAYPRTFDGRDITPAEGKSLLPALQGRSRPGHELIGWEHQGHRAIRKGDLKLVAAHGEPWELYDLRADRTETRNLAPDKPQLVQTLSADYDAWARRCDVQPFDQVRGGRQAKK